MRSATSAFLLLALLALPAAADEPRKQQKQQGHDLVFLADSRPVLIRLNVKIDGKPLAEAWEKLLNDIFDRADRNKDGILDKDEAATLPNPEELFGVNALDVRRAQRLRPAGRDGGPDLDGDGKVTRQELAEWFRKAGGVPLHLVQGGQRNNEMVRRVALDLTGLPPPTGQAEALNKALMSLLDTDGDGKLSRKELEAAPAILLKKDVDDDEMVTVTELLGQMQNPLGYEVFIDGSMPATPLGNDAPLVLVNQRDANRNLAALLVTRYDRTDQAKKSGKLTAKDLGLDDEAFGKLDADQDGFLDREELARFAGREPDLTIDMNLLNAVLERTAVGKASDIVVGKTRVAGLKVTAEKDGTVNLEIGNTHLALKLDQQQANQEIRFARVSEDELIKMQFAAADQDGNGYLDMAEARRSGTFAANFKAMDADGDGKLYLKEVQAWFKARKELRDRVSVSCVTLSLADQGRGLFDLLDADGDGRLSVREMRQAAERLLKLDRDGDGCLSASEVPRRFQVGARRGASLGSGIFPPAVAIAAPFGRGGPAPERREGPLWFRKMDRNRDGDVSRREFLGSDEQFRKIDKDGDGLISVKEAEEYDAEMRGRK